MSSRPAMAVMSIWSLIRRFLPYLYGVRWQVALAGGLMLLVRLLPFYCCG